MIDIYLQAYIAVLIALTAHPLVTCGLGVMLGRVV